MALAPVLYVEDETTDVMLAQLAFERVGIIHPLQAVSNGQKAMDYLAGIESYADRQQYPLPCLVLLDLNLPIKSGFEVLQWVRNQAQFKNLPVVVYTSSENLSDIYKARQLGANDYLVKSIYVSETDNLIHTIKERWLAPQSRMAAEANPGDEGE